MSSNNYHLDETRLRFGDHPRVKSTLRYLDHLRSLHRNDRKGRSRDKTWLDLGKIPNYIYWSQWFQQRFPVNMPKDIREKEIMKFFTQNPKLMCVDKS